MSVQSPCETVHESEDMKLLSGRDVTTKEHRQQATCHPMHELWLTFVVKDLSLTSAAF